MPTDDKQELVAFSVTQLVFGFTMWSFASKAISGNIASKNGTSKQCQVQSECSDEEPSVNNSSSSNNNREEGLECPICWESFNVVENVPYVLWCGHTLCKNCVLRLQRAVCKLPTLPIQLPFFVSCPWCNLLSFRLVYKGNLKFPRKNYFPLWIVASRNGDRSESYFCFRGDHQDVCSSHRSSAIGGQARQIINRQPCSQRLYQSGINHGQDHLNTSYLNAERIRLSLGKSLVFFVHLTAKFPLIVIFLLIVLYAIPASAAIFALHILITIVFAIPSFLILYFAFPSLDWLVRETIT